MTLNDDCVVNDHLCIQLATTNTLLTPRSRDTTSHTRGYTRTSLHTYTLHVRLLYPDSLYDMRGTSIPSTE